MAGFDIMQANSAITQAVFERFERGRIALLAELTSPGYSSIIKSVDIDSGMEKIKISFQKGIDIENQDFFELLARGGTIAKREKDKEDEYIAVKPSEVVRKYLGKR